MPVRWLRWAILLALCALVQVAAIAAAGAAGLKPPLSVHWISSMGPDPGNRTAPAVQGNRVYVTNDGVLRCLDATSGAEEWRFPAKAETEASSTGTGSTAAAPFRATTGPLVWQDLVIVGADDSGLYGLKASDGTQAWRQTLAGPVRADPILIGDELIVGAQEMVYAVGPSNGQPKWVCSLTAPVSERPVTDGSMLYFLCQDGSLQCVDAASGRYRWTVPLRTGARAFPPVIAERRVIVASGKRLVAVTRTGGIAWSGEMPVGIGGELAVVDDTLYVPGVDGLIYVLYGRSGQSQRSVTLKVDGAATAPPLLEGDVLYVATGNALIYALDRSTGADLWTYRCVAPDQGPGEASTFGVYAPMLAAGDSLYVRTGGGDLYRLSPAAADPGAPVFSDLEPEPGSALPGKLAVGLSFAVTDQGSGVDPATIKATIDGASAEVKFEPASGVGTMRLTSPKDGSHVVKVTAKDYRGNSGSVEWSFLTDVSIAPPTEAERPTSTLRQRQPTTGGTIRGRTGAQTGY
jgi:outer membrane protein assembly factor BamB